LAKLCATPTPVKGGRTDVQVGCLPTCRKERDWELPPPVDQETIATVLFTFALGTSAGDFLSEQLELGYLAALGIFAGAIVVVAVPHFGLRLNAILSFWLAYILTRPLGASIGDYLASPKGEGGLGLGTNLTSFLFLGTILALVVYLAISKRDVIPTGAAAEAEELPAESEARILVVTNKTDATPAVAEAVRERAIVGPASFFVLVPNPAHVAFDRVSEDTSLGEKVLDRALPKLEEPAGGEVSGYDEIILETIPSHVSHWLHVDLPERVAKLGYPLKTVTATH
jgi:hypothetical protein